MYYDGELAKTNKREVEFSHYIRRAEYIGNWRTVINRNGQRAVR